MEFHCFHSSRAFYCKSNHNMYMCGNISTSLFHLTNKASLVVQQPVTMVSVTYFGPHPVPLSCNICMNKITTIIHYRKGVCTWMACTGIALIGVLLNILNEFLWLFQSKVTKVHDVKML
ncbi:Lipopolysaccharide-induced tumor necrosis factor-alpha factor [Schistosoma japonicum]|uniref:Lipopolysaccharide-induced tumor necrosis factor-alpha factor n=1 Tax=Schistosoma japonicum TaxID=6182 RepID=A0A4Z2DUT1_SCHJA|nr:Lipopolysaccharide-induced tumor necrosis factor-alpha factor [Schistosoma japonicum]